MINIDLNYRKKVIHLIIESYILFIGGGFISYYVNSMFDDFDENIFNKNNNKNKLIYLVIEILIQIILLVFFSVILKDSVKYILINIINHDIKNVSMLSNIPFTTALFSYQANLLNKLKFVVKKLKL